MAGLSIRQRIALELNRQLVRESEEKHPLTQLFWESTLRCNMNCRHCGSDCKVSSIHPDMPFEDFHGLRGIGEAVFRASHPVVVAFESVEADCKGVYAGFEQLIDLLRRHETSVRDHAPREFEVVDASAALQEIFAHQRLAA